MLEVRGLDARSVAPAGWQAKDSWSFYAERLSTHALWPEDDAWAQLPGRPSSLEAPEHLIRCDALHHRAPLTVRHALSIDCARAPRTLAMCLCCGRA